MKTYILLMLTLMSVQFTWATHLIGGYIQAKPVSGFSLTYEITVALYMDQGIGNQAANQATSVNVCFGDGSSGVAERQNKVLILNNIVSLNTYRITHTYAAPNNYLLGASVMNRTPVNNITKADDLQMTLSTILSTNVTNQTPTPGFPEAGFRVGVNQRMVLALGAIDAEGDSLVYGLTKPLTSRTDCTYQPVSPYQYPNDVTRQGIFKLNSQTGELIWDAPTQQGNYSIALNLLEYRNGVLISQTTQELMLVVVDLPGTPSTIPAYEPAIEGTGGLVTGITDFDDSDVMLTTFPNPVDDKLYVSIQSSRPSTYSLLLMDMNGRKLQETNVSNASRKHERLIRLQNVASGTYLLRANVGNRLLIRKVLKK